MTTTQLFVKDNNSTMQNHNQYQLFYIFKLHKTDAITVVATKDTASSVSAPALESRNRGWFHGNAKVWAATYAITGKPGIDIVFVIRKCNCSSHAKGMVGAPVQHSWIYRGHIPAEKSHLTNLIRLIIHLES